MSLLLQDQVDKAGLPRTVRLFISAVIMVCLIWFTSFSTGLIGTFVICTYWRTLMFTREVRDGNGLLPAVCFRPGQHDTEEQAKTSRLQLGQMRSRVSCIESGRWITGESRQVVSDLNNCLNTVLLLCGIADCYSPQLC